MLGIRGWLRKLFCYSPQPQAKPSALIPNAELPGDESGPQPQHRDLVILRMMLRPTGVQGMTWLMLRAGYSMPLEPVVDRFIQNDWLEQVAWQGVVKAKLTRDDLQGRARQLGLKVSGNKSELLARLLAHSPGMFAEQGMTEPHWQVSETMRPRVRAYFGMDRHQHSGGCCGGLDWRDVAATLQIIPNACQYAQR